MTSPSISALQKAYPWTQTPLIINGPMAGFAGPHLAAGVTNAGGLGFIAGGVDMAQLAADVATYRTLLAPHVVTKSVEGEGEGDGGDAVLPVGLGFLCFGAPLAQAADVVRAHRPAAAWLFAPRGERLGEGVAAWARALREASPRTRVWVQVGSVAAAVEACTAPTSSSSTPSSSSFAPPDVLVLQGGDAGGHGFERGAGVVSLVPEAADALAEAGVEGVAVVAAGGIADGRGAAAALALGAGGVVMGTRFLACEEVTGNAGYRAAVLGARDGGVATARSKAFDEARAGGNVWPELYDGRGLVNRTYRDFVEGRGVEEIRRLHGEAQKGAGAGFGGPLEDMRVTVWAGTGVGLVREVLPAGRIVEEVREGARKVLKSLGAQI